MNWQEIIKELGVVGIISGLITFLIKELGKYFLNKRFKAYELELADKYKNTDRQLSILLENHKKSLELLFHKASKLHDRRIEVIAELYEKLVIVQIAMHEMTSLLITRTKDPEKNLQIENYKIENSSKSYDDFYLFYSKHRIFFSTRTCELIDKIKDNFFDSFLVYTNGKKYLNEDYDLSFRYLKKASDTIRYEVPSILKNIENEFRSIMGVEIENN